MTSIYALGTFSDGDGPAWPGIVRDRRVIALSHILPDAPGDLYAVFTHWSDWGSRIDEAVSAAPDNGWRSETDFAAHLPYMPDNLLGAGANYRKHVIELIVDSGAGGVAHLSPDERRAYAEREMDARAESGMPFVWVALRSSVAGPDAPLLVPHDVEQPDWEFELSVVIGKPARRVSAADALDYVAGYTMANDVTARELVTRKDLKNFLGWTGWPARARPASRSLAPTSPRPASCPIPRCFISVSRSTARSCRTKAPTT